MGFSDAVASAGPYATICTPLQTDNHTNTSSLYFYRPDALPDAQPSVKALKTQNCAFITGCKHCSFLDLSFF